MIGDLGAELDALGARKVFLVGDKGIVSTGILSRVQYGLESAGAQIAGCFIDVPPNSAAESVRKCAAQVKNSGADTIVAVGGGSVIDTAKMAALLCTHGGDLADYAGAQTVPGPIIPLVAIPTTAGTGSEVTQAAVIYDETEHRKLSFVDQYLRPRLAILDPELTVGLPPLLTAATGMDAATHAIEAFVDIEHSVVSDGMAIQSLRLIGRSLSIAVKDGGNIEARMDMLVASTLAGIAFDHSMVGVTHAMAHAVGALAPVHHGVANTILLPYGMVYNWETCKTRYGELASALGLCKPGPRAAARLKKWVIDMCAAMHACSGLPLTLKDAGVSEELLPQIAALAEEDGAGFYNPRPVEAKRILPLLRAAYSPPLM